MHKQHFGGDGVDYREGSQAGLLRQEARGWVWTMTIRSDQEHIGHILSLFFLGPGETQGKGKEQFAIWVVGNWQTVIRFLLILAGRSSEPDMI